MANKSTEQIMKAMAGLLPEDAQKEVSTAISNFLEEATKELEAEYSDKLSEAYKTVEEEKTSDEQVAERGYAQAWEIITDLRDRLAVQKEEFDAALEEGYEEAYQMLQEERSKNDTLEVSLYEEYDKRLAEVRDYMVDKIDQFLAIQGEKYYEMAKKDVMNDPAVTEHKLAFERILEVAQNYLSDEDFAVATSSRVENLNKQLDEQKAQIKILEAKSMRLATDNTRLTEAVKHQHSLISENKSNERNVRLEKARKAEGRGEGNTENRRVVIGETKDASGEPVANTNSNTIVEHAGEEIYADWKYLSGQTGRSRDEDRPLRTSK
jgi:hypothetical protein